MSEMDSGYRLSPFGYWIDPYEFNSSVEGNALVVEGSINNTDGPHVLYLSQTQESDGKAKVNGGINNPLNLVPVSNAMAVLYNSLGESVFGYFSGKSTVINRVRTFGFDIPYSIVKECAYIKDKPLYQYPPECLDCLKAPNSTTDRPDYF